MKPIKFISKELVNEAGLILPFDYRKEKGVVLDLSKKNLTLLCLDLNNVELFEKYIFDLISQNNKKFAIGKYAEDREIYKRDELFSSQKRTIHLGIDLWVVCGTEVFSPFDARVHSFVDNSKKGDYGPTIILEHDLKGFTFFTLYGHLSRESLFGLYPGKSFKKGDRIGFIGNYPENGNWPPHLHFQVILDLWGKKGDFFGVSSYSDKHKFLLNCPDPNLILGIKGL